MKKIIFATNNLNKVAEVKSILNGEFQIVSLSEAGIAIDIPEPFDTIEENAQEKARVIFSLTSQDCFAEDTGLEVAALNGEPGVRSARYAGENKSNEDNIDILLAKLGSAENREAQFKTVISVIMEGKTNNFEGICKGKITTGRKGEGGFGYDAVFIPEGAQKTFAEMNMEEKNKYSHRKKAMQLLIEFLQK
jgi:XTP/dITP diphosphohydrolase